MAQADWRDLLHDYLIKGGTSGRKRSEILVRLQRLVNSATILEELKALQLEGKADKFEVQTPSGGRKVEVWRATTKILRR